MPNTAWVIRSIKSFLRDYGIKVFWVHFDGSTRDLDSGVVSKHAIKTKIKRAVLSPEKLTRKFSYDLSYIAANKNFVYGGFYDRGDSSLIFLTKHLPTNHNLNDHVEIGSERFIVTEQFIHPAGFVGVNMTHIIGMDDVE